MKVVKRSIKLKQTGQSRVYKSHQGWRTVAGRRSYFKSGWEVNFALYLQFLKEKNQIKEWEYEPKTFWFEEIKRGTRSYLPDFKVHRLDGTYYWVEVKGYMDAKSKTKLKRFRKYYPNEQLHLVNSEWFKEYRQKIPMVSEKWEGVMAEGESE